MIVVTDITNTSGDAIDAGGDIYVARGVHVSGSSDGINGFTVYLDDEGDIYGDSFGVQAAVASSDSGAGVASIMVGANGSILSSYCGIDVGGTVSIDNAGSIQGSTASFFEGYGVKDEDVSSLANSLNLTNTGTIAGYLSFDGAAETDTIINTGSMIGAVVLGSGGGSFDSSLGHVQGTISAGAGGDVIKAGLDGGRVIGAAGNDSLQANQSKIAADNHVAFTLDGAGGVNTLYGGGAFNTFLAGDANGGHNQIRGGLSLMTDVAGYANNTLDFSSTPSGRSVYVDLLNGHNAYLYANANHSGALTFEDSIRNVPNVTGSAGGDVIRADNGTDVIQGGGGADILYAGTGFDTFVYTGYQDSNTVKGYDTISGFATGKDKLNLSAFNAAPNQLAITSGSNATTLYLENTPGTFNSATDLAISFKGANAITASDVIL